MQATLTPTFTAPPAVPFAAAASLAERYRAVRHFTEWICEPLVPEDYVIQSMPDVSPAKWHLAHTSWFFETFLLKPYFKGYREYHAQFSYLFNSYYVQVGERHCRPKRGLISRPTVSEVYQYRAFIDEHMLALIDTADEATRAAIAPLIEIGMHHEQQHQELMVTDIKHVLSINPLYPAYREQPVRPRQPVPAMQWVQVEGGLYEFGHVGEAFHFDNEEPRHQAFVRPFKLASRLVTNGEYLAFIEDGGYEQIPHWLSLGIATVQAQGWYAPEYWEKLDGRWQQFTLSGLRDVAPDEPVTHLSYFEADAYARWAGARLPTEFEWELAGRDLPRQGNFVEAANFHPVPLTGAEGGLQQMYGDVWEWTRSSYAPYPGYQPAPGALGEYNGKFMCNQYVLRGGSCATSQTHIRPTYRNFFPPDARWQFMGLRLAQDAG